MRLRFPVFMIILNLVLSERLNKVLILQSSTDDFDRQSFEWNREKYPLPFAHLSKLSALMYAQRHGYDYKFFQIDADYLPNLGRDNVWVKPLAIQQALDMENHYYDFVVSLDLDIIFMQPEISIEEKLRDWSSSNLNNKTESINAFITLDLNKRKNYFPQYMKNHNPERLDLVFNSGFMIFKNSYNTRQVIREWFNCPIKFSGCKRFIKTTNDWGSDQTALFYLEYYYQKYYSFTIQRIPCDETNGFPSFFTISRLSGSTFNNGQCSGKFVSHFWGPYTRRTVYNSIVNLLSEYVIEFLTQNYYQLYQNNTVQLQLEDPSMTISLPTNQCETCFMSLLIKFNTPVNIFQSLEHNLINQDLSSELLEVCSEKSIEESSCTALMQLINRNLQEKYEKKKIMYEMHKKKLHYERFKGNNMKVLVIQVEDPKESHSLLSEQFSTISATIYAEKHGYDYKLFQISSKDLEENVQLSNNLLKAIAIKQALELDDHYYDFVVYIDRRTIILNLDHSIEDVIALSCHHYGVEHCDVNHNAYFPLGSLSIEEVNSVSPLLYYSNVMIWKNSFLSYDIINKIIVNEEISVLSFNMFQPIAFPSSVLPTLSLRSHENNTILLGEIKKSILFRHYTMLMMDHIDNDLTEILLENIQQILPMNPYLTVKADFENRSCSGGCGASTEITLSYPIEINIPVEENYPDQPSFYQSIQESCLIHENYDPEKCNYVELSIKERVAKRYTFLKRVDKILYNRDTNERIRNEILPELVEVEKTNDSISESVTNNFENNQTVEPSKEEIEEGNSILFVTAFKEIGRGSWSKFTRTTEDYYHYFSFIAYHLPSKYYLIIYMEEKNQKELFFHYPEIKYRKNLIFHNFNDVNDSFYMKYLKKEEEIMKSNEYQKKIPKERKLHPEHYSAEYTLINHSKISFLRYSYQLYSKFLYYCWMDFGHIRSHYHIHFLPYDQLNYREKFDQNQIILSMYLIPNITNNHTYDANEMLAYSGLPYFIASHMIVPGSMILEFERLYEAKLIEWQSQYIADDDQGVLLQLYQQNSSMFRLYRNCGYHLFADHLNVVNINDGYICTVV